VLATAAGIAAWPLATRPAARALVPPAPIAAAEALDVEVVTRWFAAPQPMSATAAAQPLLPPLASERTASLPEFTVRAGRLWWVERQGDDGDHRVRASFWLKEDGFERVDLSDIVVDGQPTPPCTIGFHDGTLSVRDGGPDGPARRHLTEAARDLLLAVAGWRDGACQTGSRLVFLGREYTVTRATAAGVDLVALDPGPGVEDRLHGRFGPMGWSAAERYLAWTAEDGSTGVRRLVVGLSK